MFTLHFIEYSKTWAPVTGPALDLASGRNLIVVEETCNTKRLEQLLKAFPGEQTLILGAIQDIVSAALDHHAKPPQ